MDRGKGKVDHWTDSDSDQEKKDNKKLKLTIESLLKEKNDLKARLKVKEEQTEYWRRAYHSERKRYLDCQAWADEEIAANIAEYKGNPLPQLVSRQRPNYLENSRPVDGSSHYRITPRKKVRPLQLPVRFSIDEEKENEEDCRIIPIDEVSLYKNRDRRFLNIDNLEETNEENDNDNNDDDHHDDVADDDEDDNNDDDEVGVSEEEEEFEEDPEEDPNE